LILTVKEIYPLSYLGNTIQSRGRCKQLHSNLLYLGIGMYTAIIILNATHVTLNKSDTSEPITDDRSLNHLMCTLVCVI